ncbi:precorrin-3B C(17)-methyltransferase [Acetobacter pasteurianus]|uniref:Precorrin-3B C17-methyltransferase n=3 Tax=Acetobacter pasteurianus TaxID=438 RepID=C7JHY9_ACEP3|nr:precorrin-3B C(17)-methyltransferase [Acetobacter pasteurianus]BAU38538.1 precorrin-3B C17-methyltransferase [Acetobacter pasteurianus NBRC 101655]ASC06816.1 Precorrin-3B C(17)-methyltransferase [Acetobacter pasteurianus subsp. pasteurianus]CCT58434.1 precorrin-3B C17-methyltransferase [Acetobacter pasteurianus 386B]BAH99593.1 precorrin-3B C17-methyltransferase [Acetobacter pasteurianus IFO 3283-01]BAI02646.1 precorrin-3B C17-methyltransferase [Acetobacter pasteurianus IFO 3283-03]
MKGSVTIVGLGPGNSLQRTPQADQALAKATDLVGYGPYVNRVEAPPHVVRHASDNRVELDRARHALEMAEQGRHVAVVSGGDAGVFGMASAVFEALEQGPDTWRALDISVVPGLSAVLAAAARLGAPLGGDFCVMSLSDNLKPWDVVLERLRLAAQAGFVIALYNPRSHARPWQLGEALEHLRSVLPPTIPVAFARAIGRPDEAVRLSTLQEANAEWADMSTLVLIGCKASRLVERPNGEPWFYTLRRVDAA